MRQIARLISVAGLCALATTAPAQNRGLVESTSGDLKHQVERAPAPSMQSGQGGGQELLRRLGAIEDVLKRLGAVPQLAPDTKKEEPWAVESGKTLKETLVAWAGRAGYDVDFDIKDVTFPLSGKIDGSFEQALEQMQTYLCQADVDAQLRTYRNRVVRVYQQACPR